MKLLYKIKRWLGFGCAHDYRQIGLRSDYSAFKCKKCNDFMYRIGNEF